MRRLALVLLFAALSILGLVLYYPPSGTSPSAGTPSPATPPTSPRPQSAIRNPQSAIEAPPPASEFPLNAPTADITADLRLVSDLLGTFRSNFPQGGNPTGTNAEITAVLTGQNKLRFAFIPPRHPAINAAGELCDRWGTPFFFHAESATRMEIRSAGPDKKLWTADDVLFAP